MQLRDRSVGRAPEFKAGDNVVGGTLESEAEDRIVFGVPVAEGDAPWQAILYYELYADTFRYA